MADCFSLPNAAELVGVLRDGYDEEHGMECFTIHHHPTFMEKRAAYAIEDLMQENKKLKAERDAAVADLSQTAICWNCGKQKDCHIYSYRTHCHDWEWRGVQKGEEYAAD